MRFFSAGLAWGLTRRFWNLNAAGFEDVLSTAELSRDDVTGRDRQPYGTTAGATFEGVCAEGY